jgi:AraC-like DNA-binding protein
MPSPTKIRKDVLKALESSIIPALEKQHVALGCVGPPFRFPEGISASLKNTTVPRADAEVFGYPEVARWSKYKLHSTVMPYIGFIYGGTANNYTFLSAKQASKYKISKGIYAIRWKAPSALLFPSNTPRNMGGVSFWDHESTFPESIQFLWFELIEFESDTVHVHTHRIDNPNSFEVSHSLLIQDAALTTLIHLFVENLQNDRVSHRTIQAILLAAMSQLYDYLQHNFPTIANTSRPPSRPLQNIQSPHMHSACRDAILYIQMNLQEPHSVASIAKYVHVSTTHLNRLFHQYCGMPVMRYVLMQRISAAKGILRLETENIKEIAFLTGFSDASAFCTAFSRETGITPNQFRRQTRHKSTSKENK